MSNRVFVKTKGKIRKDRDIKFVMEKKRKNRYLSEPNYQTTKWLSEKLLAKFFLKKSFKKDKLVYPGFSILYHNKIKVYQLYGFIKKIYGNKAQLCYIDTDSFIIRLKIKDFHEDINYDM